ncbi:MAG: hypothetical protein ACK56I_32810, partial [bacterium]
SLSFLRHFLPIVDDILNTLANLLHLLLTKISKSTSSHPGSPTVGTCSAFSIFLGSCLRRVLCFSIVENRSYGEYFLIFFI